ncbi:MULTISPECIES: hypothetical protein [unclassified Streptomyces]|uniref:hypothetical protein n=1 Tax=Streptomyces sp. NPDC006678 TaxID=3157185 RepID=UPI003408B2CA
MSFEDNLTRALRASADAVTMSPAPTEAVIQRGRAILRRRNTARAAGMAAVIASCTLVTAAQLTARDSTPTRPTVAASPAESASPQPAGVRVVRAEERIKTGRGNTIWLTANRNVAADLPAFTDWAPGTPVARLNGPEPLDAVGFTDKDWTLYVGTYRGKGKLAKVTVKVDDVTLNAKVITLPGNPGWAAFYVNAPRTSKHSPKEWLTGYAADGTVLAHTPPVELRR